MSAVVQFKGWTMSRLEDYDQCPAFSKWKHLLKLCQKCFKGRLFGGYGEPELCDACGAERFMAGPWARGTEIGDAIDANLKGKKKKPHAELRHPAVLAMMRNVAGQVRNKTASVQNQIVLNEKWEPVSQFTKDAWFRGKLDVLSRMGKKLLQVIDWKTGSIDKRTGGIDMRKKGKYDDQLSIYNTAALSANPDADRCTSALVFVDVGPRFEPIMAKPELDVTRKDLKKSQKAWEKRVLPMLSDKAFAPRPGYYCGYCPYSKAKKGPCRF
jgi:hypothetical protein